MQVRPFPWLELNASYAYSKARYSQYSDGQSDYSGHQIPFDARNQYHFGGELHFQTPALGAGEVRLGADVTYRSKVYFDDQNDTPEFILKNTVIRGLTNAHLTWASNADTWEVSLWGKNITNTRYLIVASDLTPFYANLAEYASAAGNKMFDGNWSSRSLFGISANYKF